MAAIATAGTTAVVLGNCAGKIAPGPRKNSGGGCVLCAEGPTEVAPSRSTTAEDIVQQIAVAARSRGLDITVGLTLQDYNRAVESDGLELPTFGRTTTLAVLLGSHKAIWVPFIAALRAATPPGQLDGQAEHDGPLNAYVVGATSSLVREVLMPLGINHTVRYAHEVEDGRLVAMQKLAHLSGVAYLHPSCGLNVHKDFGPWHAYRSLIIIDIDGVPTAGPPPNPNTPDAIAAADAALALALESTVDPTATNSKEDMDAEMRKVWRLWQNIRVALSSPACAEWRYEDTFDEYHFTHSPEVLARILATDVHVGQGERDSNVTAGAAAVLDHTKGNL
eukprot:COSAG02_NODE_4748_length_5028_cov_2.319537_5_plen_335_part_00